LQHRPFILSDTGLALISTYISQHDRWVYAACEITTSGISRLRNINPLPLPVININAGCLKQVIENFHGVGDGIVEALSKITGRSWINQKCTVIGYGPVGAGCARYLRQAGLTVSVVDINPIAQLSSHYDGFVVNTLEDALPESKLIVTATGIEKLLTREQWQLCADQVHVFNVGHSNQELDLDSLKEICSASEQISPHLDKYTLANGQKSIYVATGGHPVNVVLLSGSTEPTLIHLTTEVLTWNFLAKSHQQDISLPAQELLVPRQVEQQAALLAVKALGFNRNSTLS
jgi:adenosylhomocysteinase